MNNNFLIFEIVFSVFILIIFLISFSQNRINSFESYTSSLENFTIFGERCSGTNYLEQAIRKNFNLPITWKYGWKHWFGNHVDYSDSDNTLFIAIYRNPFDWMNSLYHDQHHLEEKMKNKDNFIKDPFFTFHNGELEMKNSINWKTNKPFQNVFELRSAKLLYLLEVLPQKAKNVEIISYEYFKDNYHSVLKYLQKKYNLQKKQKRIKTIDYHLNGGSRSIFFRKKKVFHAKNVKHLLNLETEKKAGYII